MLPTLVSIQIHKAIAHAKDQDLIVLQGMLSLSCLTTD